MTPGSRHTCSRRVFVAGAAAALVAARFGPARVGAGAYGTPRVSLPDLPQGTWEDGLATGAAWAGQLWGGSLLAVGVDGAVSAGIASTMTLANDRVALDLVIRPDAFFSDGSQITTDDVVASILRARDRAAPAYEGWRWEHLHAVEARPDRVVHLDLDEPDASLVATLASHWAPVVPARWVDDDWDEGQGPFPPASGCFVRERVSDDGIRCVRSDVFYQVGRPRLAGATCLPPSSEMPRAMEVVTGTVDLLIDAPLLDVPTLREDPGITLVGGDANTLCHLNVNLRGRVVSDRRVRELLYRAIDRDALVQAATAGEATPATSLIEPGHWAGLEDPVETLAADDVRSGLEALGVAPGVELRLVVDPREASLANAGVLLQDQLAYAGIAISLELVGADEMRTVMREGAWDLRLTRTSFWLDPHELVRPLLVTGASDNAGGYANGRVDYLVDLARRARYEPYRGDLYRTIQRIARDDVPLIPLYFPRYYDAMVNQLQGYPYFPPVSARAMHQVVMVRPEPEASP